MTQKRTAVLLARGGSVRLPRKALLPWAGTTLLGWAIQQTLYCPSVDLLIVGSDDQTYLKEASAVATKMGCAEKVWCVTRHPVPPDESSYTSLFKLMHLVASQRVDNKQNRVLLVQCTSPFINPGDLEMLCQQQDSWEHVGHALSADALKPSGMGYLVFPNQVPASWRYVRQAARGDDIDTLQQYRAALNAAPAQPMY